MKEGSKVTTIRYHSCGFAFTELLVIVANDADNTVAWRRCLKMLIPYRLYNSLIGIYVVGTNTLEKQRREQRCCCLGREEHGWGLRPSDTVDFLVRCNFKASASPAA